MSTELNFRQLIDLAIGSPEPGHVNFYALHFLLFSFAEKLNIIDEPVDNTKYENISIVMSSGKFGSESYDHYQSAAVSLGKASLFKHAKDITKRAEEYSHKNIKRLAKRQIGGADPEEQTAAGDTELEEVTEAQSSKEDNPTEMAEEAATEPAPIVEENPAEPEDQPRVVEEQPAEVEELTDKPQSEKQTDLELIPASEYKEDEGIDQGLEVKTSGEELDIANQEAQPRFSQSVYRGIAIMKDQLELTMEMVRLLVIIAVKKKASPKQLDTLRSLSNKLVAIQYDNVHIERAFSFRLLDGFDDTDMERVEDGEDEGEEESELRSDPSYKSALTSHIIVASPPQPPEEYDLDTHLCYSPDKLLDQLMDLKSEFCMLTNKVNEISATILEQDCQRTTMLIADLQEQMKDLKFYVSSLKEAADRMESKNINNSEIIEELTKSLEEIMNEKIDKSEIEILLADKVDYNQLQRKVSQEQMQEFQCRLEKRFTEVHKQIKVNDKNMYQAMDNIRTSLGLSSVDDILNRFKEKIEAEIQGLQETLRKYMDATNDECAAAGARIKVLQDLACISCDTTCVMRTMEKSKVAKLPNAHATNLLSPLITYEIGSIRKSGIMGYYRKDEFPHAPNAWLNQQKVSMKMCVPRHAGGPHTTHTAKEHFEKVVVNKK